jgi:hypothetical protein
MSGVPGKQPNERNEDLGRSSKLTRPLLSKRALILLIAAACIILLISFFGDRLTNTVCREAYRVTPFQGPFSTVFLSDLFLAQSVPPFETRPESHC